MMTVNNLYQRTVKNSVSVEGTGLHTGEPTRLTFLPAPADSGIAFRRTDLSDCPDIEARTFNIVDLSRGTTIGKDDVKIHTVEHVMAALLWAGIDNVLVTLDGPEPPVGDGSASVFTDALKKAGNRIQGALRRELIIDRPVDYHHPDSNIILKIYPSDVFRVTFLVDYADSVGMGTRFYTLEQLEDFDADVAPARTYSLLSEMEAVKKRGLGKGGSLDNNIVFVDEEMSPGKLEELRDLFGLEHEIRLGSSGILDDRPLRFPNEPVRHKVLDLIGDLYMLGMPVRGHVMAFKSGHSANAGFVKILEETYRGVLESPEQPGKEAVLLNSLIPSLAPVPASWRTKKNKNGVVVTCDPGMNTRLSEAELVRLCGLAAATAVIYDGFKKISSLSIRSLKKFKFDLSDDPGTLKITASIDERNKKETVAEITANRDGMKIAAGTIKLETESFT